MALNKYSSSRRFTNTTTLERDYEGYRGGNKAKQKKEYSAYRAEKLAKESAIDDLHPTASDMPEHGDLQGPNTRLIFDKNKGTGTMYTYGTQNDIRRKEPVTRGNIRGMMQRIQQDIDTSKKLD